MTHLTHAPLGKKSDYTSQYDPALLFPIPRSKSRNELGLKTTIPFYGYDIWNAYEISWLNAKGKPQVAIGEFYIAANSLNIVESKSFKLYLNSFNNTKFNSEDDVVTALQTDLTQATDGSVVVKLYSIEAYPRKGIAGFQSTNLDKLDVECSEYHTNANLLMADPGKMTVSETVYSNLLKSNCLITSQPDWASVEISYTGPKIAHDSLLKYIVSFRNHNEFHEPCVERIFMDIYTKFKPTQLTVYARYTRRGGLDINPIRSTESISLTEASKVNQRQPRQ